MKKIYFLFLGLLIALPSFSQVIITEIADPDNNAEARFIELYNMGATAVDFTEGNGWQIDKYLNGNTGVAETLDLTGIIPAGGFYIIAYDNTPGTFQTVYGFAPDQLDGVNNGVSGSNGDDDLALVNGSDVIVDFFGVYDFGTPTNTDNSGTCAEYEDGRAERLTSVTMGSTTFNEAEWNVWADSTVSGCTSHQNAPRTAPGDFDPGAWGTPTCGLSLFGEVATCDAVTPGTDTYNVSLNFTGGNTAAYSVSSDSGTIGGDDPNSVASGTITVTGVSEGTDVTITVTGDGGLCDLNVTVTSPVCEPATGLPFYESFNYSIGGNLSDQADWTGFNSGDDYIVTSGSLSYPGLIASSGNSISFDGSGMEVKTEFSPVTTGTIYSSFILNVTDQTAMTDLTDGGYLASLAASDSGYDLRLWVRPNPDASGSTYDIAISDATSCPPFTSSTYNVNSNIFIVMSYEPSTGNFKGWINPDSSSFGGTERTPDITGTDATAASQIDRFILRQDSTGETPFMQFDELRIGTTWSDVTPATLSTIDFQESSVKLYPNPTSNGLVNISSASNEPIQVAVYDILGKQVKTETVSNGTLNVSGLTSGMYILNISQNGASTTKKLVIK
ncbi:MAG TPA: T9SS type A sorting domain-containing protein [Flavobacteriaceae bacterium]|nr:T9SS type A sorting domain-containing protein [Flavobacteriaceae bacterium]